MAGNDENTCARDPFDSGSKPKAFSLSDNSKKLRTEDSDRDNYDRSTVTVILLMT